MAAEKEYPTLPKPIYNVEGAGNETFSNAKLAGTIFAVPLLLTIFLGFPIYWYPLVLLLTALPTFALYNFFYSAICPPIRPQKGLPGKPIEDYIDIKDESLKVYSGRNKIPMEILFESYFDEKLDFKGDVQEILEQRHDFVAFRFSWGQVKFFLTQWIPETLWHSKKQDEDQVRDHYDRGDDFYAAFLGETMVYTSGIFHDINKVETLEEMQLHKLDLVCQKARLQPGDKHLDIGCGWGTLVAHAAKNYGSVSTGVTLGKNQTAFGNKRCEDYGVASKTNILCMDYRDIPKEKYDKITCLEMAEHVGVRNFQTFLLQVREMLQDDGLFFMQIVGLRR